MTPRRDKLLSYDPERKIATYAQFDPLPDGRMHTKVWYTQEVPDNWKDVNREIGQMQEAAATRSTQDHWRHVAKIPDALMNQLIEEYGNPVMSEDASERWRKYVFNNSDYRDLRTGGGRI